MSHVAALICLELTETEIGWQDNTMPARQNQTLNVY